MTQPIPPGHEGIIPHLVIEGAADALEFYKKAFGAEEVFRMPAPGGDRLMHAEMLISGKPVYLADDFPEFCGGKAQNPKALGGTPMTIHQYVENCDTAIDRAVEAGASIKMPPTDMFWGDRYGAVTDPYGHSWSFATHQKDLTPEEMAQGMNEAFSQGG